jgi:DNA-binding response OmpR family regulator
MSHDGNTAGGVVVDAQQFEYEALARAMRSDAGALWFLANGREALRLAAVERPSLWLIGVELPDMSGFDLLEMLGDRVRNAAVCLIGQRYSVDEEQQARQSGATMYVCKPLDSPWVLECVRRLWRNALVRRDLERQRIHGKSPPARSPTSIQTPSAFHALQAGIFTPANPQQQGEPQ